MEDKVEKNTQAEQQKEKRVFRSSSQDGGISRNTLLPCTTKRRKPSNLKRKNNKNCHKIKLYGSLTTKELKKKHSSRLVGGAEIRS